MSDLMLLGVLRMPYEMAMDNELSRRQFYDRAQQAADRIEAEPTPPSAGVVTDVDFEEAIAAVEKWYAEDIFTDPESVSGKMARMCRQTCKNVRTELAIIKDRKEEAALAAAPKQVDPYPWLARVAIPPYQPPFPGE